LENIVSEIGFHWDQGRQMLWFHATLTSGAQFDVGFPLAHVTVTFDSQMAEVGFVGGGCGSIPTIEGFVYEVEAFHKSPNTRLRVAAGRSMHRTLTQLAHEGLHYGANAYDASIGYASIGEPSLEQVRRIVADRIAHPRKLSPAAQLWQTRSGFTAEDSAKHGLVNQIPDRYRPWLRGSNNAGYFTQKIVDAQKPSVDERRAQHDAFVEAIDPGFGAKMAAAREGQKHVGTDKTFGKGFQSAVQQVGTTALKSVSTVARVAGNVATVIPGVGTVAAYGLQFASSVGEAAASGKNLLAAAKTAAVQSALNSLPGGELTGALIKTVSNVAAAGIEGHNLLQSASHEVLASAIDLVPNKEAQMVLHSAADAALSGQNVLQGAKSGVIQAALNQIPDPTARNTVAAALSGKSPADIVQSAGKDLLAKAAGSIPTGGAAALVQGIIGKSPNDLHAMASRIAPPVRQIIKAATPPGSPPNASDFFGAIGAQGLRNWKRI
jgi:hypothetical protein